MDFKEGTEKETRPFVATNKTQMTLREALFILDDENKCSKRDIEAFTVLKDFITATEQVTTLEKLGWVKEDLSKWTFSPKIKARYRKECDVIDIYENGVSVWNEYGEVDHVLPNADFFALAEVIKEMEKEEKMKGKEETK